MTFEDHKKSAEEIADCARAQGRVEGFKIVLAFIEGIDSVDGQIHISPNVIARWLEKQIADA